MFKKYIVYIILLIFFIGTLFAAFNYFYSDNKITNENITSSTGEVGLDYALIEDLINNKLDTEIFGNIKFISLEEPSLIQVIKVTVGNKSIFESD